MFASPMIYPVPDKWRRLLWINPMTGIIEGLFVISIATALTVWINDKFDIGGDYIEIKSEQAN